MIMDREPLAMDMEHTSKDRDYPSCPVRTCMDRANHWRLAHGIDLAATS